jgi:DNA-binding CsgD family transcriptional regulator
VGFLLVDSSLNPVYINAEAIQILTYPQSPTEITALDRSLSEKIRSHLPEDPSSPNFPLSAEFMSGRRRYLCRVLSVNSRSEVSSHATALLLERSAQRSLDLAQAAEAFQLSSRQQETVTYLLQGLTSKEIAQRMHISPYTVKAYVRLIMIKMDVTTRSGIVGKLVRNSAHER